MRSPLIFQTLQLFCSLQLAKRYMSHIFGCKQTPPTPPTTSDEESSGSTSDAETKKKKGNRAMGKKKYPKAIKYYSKAIKIDPENATYHLNRAIANSALELWKDAELDAAKAVELADQQAPAKSHYQLVRARLRRGRCLEAREALKLGLQRFSEDKALQQLGKEVDRAVALLEAKRRKEAEEEEERSAAKSAGPCGAKALTDQARQLSERQPEAALPLLEEALQAARQARQRREEINAQSLMGKVQLKLRRWAEAVASSGRGCGDVSGWGDPTMANLSTAIALVLYTLLVITTATGGLCSSNSSGSCSSGSNFLQFASRRGGSCASFEDWPDVDGVQTRQFKRCDDYCASFKHKCVAAAEEKSETPGCHSVSAAERDLGATRVSPVNVLRDVV
eukprot:g22400.t1